MDMFIRYALIKTGEVAAKRMPKLLEKAGEKLVLSMAGSAGCFLAREACETIKERFGRKTKEHETFK